MRSRSQEMERDALGGLGPDAGQPPQLVDEARDGERIIHGISLRAPEERARFVDEACQSGEQFAGPIEGTSTVDKDGDDELEMESSEGKLTLVH